MASQGERWAFWLETQLEDRGWRAADLVRASGLKENGRPVIDAPRVSAWLKGERPSFELASLTAQALNIDPVDALVVAGYVAAESANKFRADCVAPVDAVEQPVGLGLDAEAAGLTPEEIEPVLAIVRAIKRAKGLQ